MKEKDIQRLFGKVINIAGVFELKLCKGNSLPYNAVKEHQIEALLDISTGKGLFHKISDVPVSWVKGNRIRGTLAKPFDCFYIKRYPAYIGICYYKPRQPKKVYLIDIQIFISLKIMDDRKSLTEDKANKVSQHIVEV